MVRGLTEIAQCQAQLACGLLDVMGTRVQEMLAGSIQALARPDAAQAALNLLRLMLLK